MDSHYKFTYFTMSGCTFAMNSNFVVLKIPHLAFLDAFSNDYPVNLITMFAFQNIPYHLFCTIIINNSVFIQTGSGKDLTIIYCRNTVSNLNGPLVFKNFKSKNSMIIVEATNLTIHEHLEFFNNTAVSLFSQKHVYAVQIKQELLLNISNNKFYAEIFSYSFSKKFEDTLQNPYPLCIFQYICDKENLDHQFATGKPINFSIIIHKTKAHSLSNLHVMHCKWQPNSAFKTTSPLLVNQRFISDFNKWNNIYMHTERILCSCLEGKSDNCTENFLGPVYPGENATFSLALLSTTQLQSQNTTKTVPIDLETNIYSPLQCTFPTSARQNINTHGCSNVSYTLFSASNIMCELLFKQIVDTVYGSKRVSYIGFYVKLLPCPPGFMFIQMRCQYNPVLIVNEYVKDCDINDQSILRSSHSWIFYNKPLDTYQLSKNCPFDYCYPHSSIKQS